MAKRIPWDRYEIALLLVAYEKIANGDDYSAVALQLSNTLRQLAIHRGIEIDETYRNVNGMNMQLGNVQYLFTNGKQGLSNASRAIRNMYEMYRNNHTEFEAVLKEANKLSGVSDETIKQPEKNPVKTHDAPRKTVKRVPWDIYETSLLFMAYEQIINGNKFADEATWLSIILRKLAVNRGLEIDEVYRNINGVAMHLYQVQFLFTDGKKGLPVSSKLIQKMFDIYQNKPIEYQNILKEAIQLSGETTQKKKYSTSIKSKTEQLSQIELFVLQSDLAGVTFDDIAEHCNMSMLGAKNAVKASINIVSVHDRLLHKEAFVDWEIGADCLQAVLEKLMKKNNGYVSAIQLFEYARLDMAMFMNDNDMNTQRKIYDMAEHLFGKENYHGIHYTFQGHTHISQSKESISSKLDIIKKYARDEGGFICEKELEKYLKNLGINHTHTRQYMKLYEVPDYLFYEPGYLITAESIGITPKWLDKVKKALDKLFDDVGDHIVIRDIHPLWYQLLPELPNDRQWTALLLQNILRFYNSEIGARTIYALDTQSIETLHAMIVSFDSEIQTFSDAVLSIFAENRTNQFADATLTYTREELREILVEHGLIAGRELKSAMPDALPSDEHFVWDLENKNITIKI